MTQAAFSNSPTASSAGRGFLAQEAVEEYRDNGCLFPMVAMSPEQAAKYVERVEAFEKQYGARAKEILRSKSHLVLTWANELIRLEPVLDAVESIIGPNIYCWGSSFFIKNAKDPGYVAWHQDAPFSGMSEGEFLTAWIALSVSNEANGCLKVVPGTHKTLVKHERRDNTSNLLSEGQEIAVEVKEEDASKIVLQPGQFSLHHEMIFHGSGPNTADYRRIGLAVRYVNAFQRKRPRKDTDAAFLVRGTDLFDTFAQEPSPASDMDPSAVAYLDNFLVRKYGDRYRKGAATS